MAAVPFKDVFISYAQKDNQRAPDEEIGWIDRLGQTLKIRLDQICGRETQVFHDAQLRRDGPLTREISDLIRASRVLLSVLSPAYVNSGWCKAELRLFCSLSHAMNDVLAARDRLAKVIKTPPSPKDMESLPELADLLGHEFYRLDDRHVAWEFDPKLGIEALRDFYRKVNELATEIGTTLNTIGSGVSSPQTSAPSSSVVYLADTAFDVAPQRESLRDALQDLGHRVLPDVPLDVGPRYEQDVREEMDRCTLSLHLIGGDSELPDLFERSLAEIQYDVAGEQAAKRPEFRRLSWLRRGIKGNDLRQQRFIKILRDDCDFVMDSIEYFKSRVEDVLAGRAAPNPTFVPLLRSGSEAPLVYVIFDREDADSVKTVADALTRQGVALTYPEFDGAEDKLAKYHRDSLTSSDGVLIYRKARNNLWLRSTMLELHKARGYRNGRPFAAKALVFGDAETMASGEFSTVGFQVYVIDETFGPKTLEPFVAALAGSQDQAM